MSLREDIEMYTMRIEANAAAEGLVQTASNIASELDQAASMIPPAAQTMIQAATTLLDGSRELITAYLKESKSALIGALNEVTRLASLEEITPTWAAVPSAPPNSGGRV